MLSIDEDEYVDYNVGAVFPEGLSYLPGQGLVIYGQETGTGVERKQLVINPDALQGTVTQVNLFDSEKGELNPDLYDQMALPEGMSYNKINGLQLTGSGDNAKTLTINPNVIPKNIQLFDIYTQKIDSSLSSLPTGLTYTENEGLEIRGETLINTLVINPNGFTKKTSLFDTTESKINEDLYIQGGDSRLPDWVEFDDTDHTIAIGGFPQEGAEPGLVPRLFINGGAIHKNVYIISTDTGFLKAELPDGMTYSRTTGLTLENNSGGRVVIPVGDGYINNTQELFTATNYMPDPYEISSTPTMDVSENPYYMACCVPLYLSVVGSNTVLHSSISGYYFNNEDNTTKRMTNIGGASMHLWEKDKSGTIVKDVIIVNDDGLDPNGIQPGIDAGKITKGTLTRPIIITNETKNQKMMIDYNSIRTQNGIVSGETVNYYDTFLFTNQKDQNTNIFHPCMVFFNWDGAKTVPEIGFSVYEDDIKDYATSDITMLSADNFHLHNNNDNILIDSKEGIKYKGTNSIFQIYPSGNMGVYDVNTTGDSPFIVSENGITYRGKESTFTVDTNGYLTVRSNEYTNNYTHILDHALESVVGGVVLFRSTGSGYINAGARGYCTLMYAINAGDKTIALYDRYNDSPWTRSPDKDNFWRNPLP